MKTDRAVAEWLNLADAVDRLGDQIAAAGSDHLARAYAAKQALKAFTYASRLAWLFAPHVADGDRLEVRGICERMAFMLDNPNPPPQSTGERRGT